MNIFSSIYHYKCPRCRQGDLFKKPLDISKPLDMNENCSCCNQSFSPEPGYYYGAMFISYIWTSFASLGLVAFFIWGLGWGVNASLFALVVVGAISFLWVLRISRSMYIHLDVRYDPEKADISATTIQSTK